MTCGRGGERFLISQEAQSWAQRGQQQVGEQVVPFSCGEDEERGAGRGGR